MPSSHTYPFETIALECAVLRRVQRPGGKPEMTVAILNLPAGTRVVFPEPAGVVGDFSALWRIMARPLAEMSWPPRVRDAFVHDRLIYLGDLCTISERFLRRNPGIADKTIKSICDILAQENLALGMQLSWWDDFRDCVLSPGRLGAA